MDGRTEALIREAAAGSRDGRLPFGQVVAMLVEAGVESYTVDYRARRTTYFLTDEQSLDIPLDVPSATTADLLDDAALTAAIRGAQRGEVAYPEFKRLSRQAGCVGYVAWLAGRKVTYFGRRGETHVEHFPRT